MLCEPKEGGNQRREPKRLVYVCRTNCIPDLFPSFLIFELVTKIYRLLIPWPNFHFFRILSTSDTLCADFRTAPGPDTNFLQSRSNVGIP